MSQDIQTREQNSITQVNTGGDNGELIEVLDRIGVDTTYEARKFHQVLEAKRPVIKAHKEYENGKLVSIDEEVEMVDDPRVQVSALKLLLEVKGRLNKEKKSINMKQFIGKVFVTQTPSRSQSPEVVVESHPMEDTELPDFSSNIEPHKPENTEGVTDGIGWSSV